MRFFLYRILFILFCAAFILPLCSLHPFPEKVSISHDLPSQFLTGEEKEFSLTIHKAAIAGPARLIIVIPQSGMEFTPVDLAGAELQNQGDQHTIVWTEIPSGPDVKLKLKLKSHKFFTGIFTAKFVFSYLDAGSTQEKELASFDIRMSSSGKKQTAAVGQSTGNETGNQSTTSTTQNTSQEYTSHSTQNSNTTTTVKKGTPIADASQIKGLFFRVQVAASHFLVSQEYFANRYKFNETLYIDRVDGWIKYTIGEFKTFEEANAKRKTLNVFPFIGPFIVAFNDGQRIPIYNARQLIKLQN